MKASLDSDTTLKLLALLLCAFTMQIYIIVQDIEMSEAKSENARLRRKKTRIPFANVDTMLNDRQFRRMFRMDRDCFHLLCDKIKIAVGEESFKSDAYIGAFMSYPGHMQYANIATTGGYISGEVKVAITLRLLAGGDALDLGVIFDVSSSWCNIIMYEVIQEWIIPAKLGGIDIASYLEDEAAMLKVSTGFSKRSNGVLCGAIEAIDGWLVRIQRPSYWFDGIKNPVTFSRGKIFCFECAVYRR